MKIKHLLTIALMGAVASFAVSCTPGQEIVEGGDFEISQSSVEIPTDGTSTDIELQLTSSLAWQLKGYTEDVQAWLNITPTSGKGSATIKVSALKNEGANREATITFYANKANEADVKFSQIGPKGDADLITVAEFLTLKDTKNEYKLQGTISGVTNTTYKGFDLTDSTGTIACAFPVNFDDYASKLQNRGLVTIKGVYSFYEKKGTDQLANGTILNYENPVAHDAVSATIKEFLDAKNPSVLYKLTGTVEGFNSKYTSFDLNDGTGKVYVYSVTAESKTQFGAKISDGVEVTLQGYYYFYENTEDPSKSKVEIMDAEIISVGEAKPVDLTEYENAAQKTVADIIASKDSSTFYKYVGTVSNYAAANGRFDLTDATGTIYVYEVKNKDRFTMKDGGTVTLAGTYSYYGPNQKSELVGVYLLAYDASTEKAEEQLAHPLTSGIKWTLGTAAYDNTSTGQSKQSAVVNGVTVDNLLKLSSSSKAGTATLTIPDGVTKIGFYSACWAGLDSTDITIGEKSVTVPANPGLTSNPPFILSMSDSANYFTVAVTPGNVTVTCSKRVVLIGINPVSE